MTQQQPPLILTQERINGDDEERAYPTPLILTQERMNDGDGLQQDGHGSTSEHNGSSNAGLTYLDEWQQQFNVNMPTHFWDDANEITLGDDQEITEALVDSMMQELIVNQNRVSNLMRTLRMVSTSLTNENNPLTWNILGVSAAAIVRTTTTTSAVSANEAVVNAMAANQHQQIARRKRHLLHEEIQDLDERDLPKLETAVEEEESLVETTPTMPETTILTPKSSTSSAPETNQEDENNIETETDSEEEENDFIVSIQPTSSKRVRLCK